MMLAGVLPSPLPSPPPSGIRLTRARKRRSEGATRAEAGAFGLLVSSRRRALGLTQKILAGLLGVTEGYISKLESGAKVPRHGAILPSLALALRVDFGELLAALEERAEPAGGIGAAFREARVRAGLTQADLARAVRTYVRVIDDVEAGRSEPCDEFARACEEALGLVSGTLRQ